MPGARSGACGRAPPAGPPGGTPAPSRDHATRSALGATALTGSSCSAVRRRTAVSRSGARSAVSSCARTAIRLASCRLRRCTMLMERAYVGAVTTHPFRILPLVTLPLAEPRHDGVCLSQRDGLPELADRHRPPGRRPGRSPGPSCSRAARDSAPRWRPAPPSTAPIAAAPAPSWPAWRAPPCHRRPSSCACLWPARRSRAPRRRPRRRCLPRCCRRGRSRCHAGRCSGYGRGGAGGRNPRRCSGRSRHRRCCRPGCPWFQPWGCTGVPKPSCAARWKACSRAPFIMSKNSRAVRT